MASLMKMMTTTSLHLRRKKPNNNMKRKHSLRKNQLKQQRRKLKRKNNRMNNWLRWCKRQTTSNKLPMKRKNAHSLKKIISFASLAGTCSASRTSA
jgi:hypothetical protein